MAYATVADVETFNALRTFGASTRPNVNDVVGFLTETGAVLDGILSAQNYTLPIPATATSALELLEGFNAIGAWFYSEAASEMSSQVEVAQRAWERAQQMLRDGLVELPDVTRDSSVSSFAGSFAPTAMFTRDQQF